MKSVLVLVQKIIVPRVSLSFHPFHHRPWGQNKAAAMMRGPGTDPDPVYNDTMCQVLGEAENKR